MRVITGDDMAAIDRYSIQGLGIPGIILMENAALKVLKHIDVVRHTDFVVVCGTGNNGADGLAIARHLLNYDHHVKIYIIGDIDPHNEEYMTYYRILQSLGQEFKEIHTIGDLENFEQEISRADLIIDAIFGTGLGSQVRGVQEYVIDMINHSKVEILSVDMPSGMDANNGRIHGVCVHPNRTVTFQFMKKGLEQNPLIAGDVVVESVSIPKKAVERVLGREIIR